MGIVLMEVLVVVLIIVAVVVLVLGVIVGGGHSWRPVRVPVDVAEVACAPVWAQVPPEKVS
jgi:hypothetical protein